MSETSTAGSPASKPLAEGLFTWPSADPALIGGNCPDCGYTTFPYQRTCVACDGDGEMEQTLLPRRGTLWTFTTQAFRPTSPPYAGNDDVATFAPYTVGYIELPGAGRLESRLTEPDPAKLRIGQPMSLVIEKFTVDESGADVVMFAFTPDADQTEEVSA